MKVQEILFSLGVAHKAGVKFISRPPRWRQEPHFKQSQRAAACCCCLCAAQRVRLRRNAKHTRGSVSNMIQRLSSAVSSSSKFPQQIFTLTWFLYHDSIFRVCPHFIRQSSSVRHLHRIETSEAARLHLQKQRQQIQRNICSHTDSMFYLLNIVINELL